MKLRINLLGQPTLDEGGKITPLLLGSKITGLLALLAKKHRTGWPREEVAALLWPDRFDEQSRQSLRQALTTLRKRLYSPQAIISEGGELRLNSEICDLDIREFEECTADGSEKALRRATKLYRGEFVTALPTVSREFDDWFMLERASLSNLAIIAHEKLIAISTAAGDLKSITSQSKALLAIDSGNEAAHRALMSAYAAAGRTGAAIRQFDLCRETLSKLSDSEPEAATTELAEQIRAQHIKAPLPRITSPVESLESIRFWLRRPIGAITTLGAAIVLTAGLYLLTRNDNSDQQTISVANDVENACVLSGLDLVSGMPSLMVLPLAISSGPDASEAYEFPLILQESIRGALLLLSEVAIIEGPPGDHPDLRLDTRELAQKHGVSHFLRGNLSVAENAASLRLSLTNATNGRILWNAVDEFDLDSVNPDNLKNRLAYDVVRAVQFHITDGPQTTNYLNYDPLSFETFRLNTSGYLNISTLDQGRIPQARENFRAAMERDPEDAGATNGYAMSHLVSAVFGWSSTPLKDLQIAKEYAARALALNPDFHYTYSTLGLLSLIDGDHTTAIQHGQRAIQINHNNADGTAILAFILTYAGQNQQAEDLARRAVSLRPYASPAWVKWALARAMRLNGNPLDAVRCLESAGAPNDVAPLAVVEYIASLVEAGEIERATSVTSSLEFRLADHMLTATRVCSFPPYLEQSTFEKCVGVLKRAGFPE